MVVFADFFLLGLVCFCNSDIKADELWSAEKTVLPQA